MPNWYPEATPVVFSLAIAGGVAATVGNIEASIAELVLTKKRLDEANERSQTAGTVRVFEFFDELNFAADDLFSTSTSSRILADLIDFLNKVPTILDLAEPLQGELYLCLRLTLPNLTKFLVIGNSLASVILSIFFAPFLVRRQGCAILNHHLALGLVGVVNDSVEIIRFVTAATLKCLKVGELIFRALTRKIVIGAIAGVGITLDIKSIFTSFVEGRIRDKILMLSEVAYKLKAQLLSYRNVNDELQKCVSQV
ncbi:hypothetical protein AVEN_242450-1 [Araneus ventricosus]|uniref:Uncharacterized protein n=1 Tax=Araneus ventricosus TaxID=182803 RepID=A0A4Y2K9G2_ARAVE|nr:hypothetical protein AVEN_242450-1 [Araneus ventricosus]